MLESFIYSFNSVIPIFLLVILGMFLRGIKFLKDDFCRIADKLVFNVALPFEMFKSVSQTDFEKIFSEENMNIIVFFLIGITLGLGALILITPLILKDDSKRGSFVQGAFRGNFAIFAIPLATNMFGEAGKIAATPLLIGREDPIHLLRRHALVRVAQDLFFRDFHVALLLERRHAAGEKVVQIRAIRFAVFL